MLLHLGCPGATRATPHGVLAVDELQPRVSASCNTSVWTFGLATSCCDVHPTAMPVTLSGVGRWGALMWPNRPGDVDYQTVEIRNGSIVYCPASQTALPSFVARLARFRGCKMNACPLVLPYARRSACNVNFRSCDCHLMRIEQHHAR